MTLTNKHVLVTGGTGSLGKTIVQRLLEGSDLGIPSRITVFSRDEAKQHQMRVAFRMLGEVTDEVIYQRSLEIVDFIVGDIREHDSVCRALKGVHVVFNAAALKQVPNCELFPHQAVLTNIGGAQNLIRVIRDSAHTVEHVIGISTDKACKPINVMGMTKAIMERQFIEANRQCDYARFNLVRYGNVIASRGSVVPLFLQQIDQGGPLTITTRDMTRFLLSLDRAVDTVFEACSVGKRGETFVPKVEAARITDLAEVLIDGRDVPIMFVGIRPGEKIHEIMVSEEEIHRTVEQGNYYVILPMLEDLSPAPVESPALKTEYSSQDVTLDRIKLRALLDPIVPKLREGLILA